jgi:hypothetical protein
VAKRATVYVCESCGRDTLLPARLCRDCQSPDGDSDHGDLARLRDRFGRRDRDDDAGRDADEGWAYGDGELDG